MILINGTYYSSMILVFLLCVYLILFSYGEASGKCKDPEINVMHRHCPASLVIPGE